MLHAQKVGLTLGGVVALMHLVWSVLVALGLAQGLVNWILRVHMLQASHTVLPFSMSSAVVLVVVTGLVGCAVGYVFASLWNLQQK